MCSVCYFYLILSKIRICRQILLKTPNFKRHEIRQMQVTLTHADGRKNDERKKKMEWDCGIDSLGPGYIPVADSYEWHKLTGRLPYKMEHFANS
jgi:hypothetical protein